MLRYYRTIKKYDHHLRVILGFSKSSIRFVLTDI